MRIGEWEMSVLDGLLLIITIVILLVFATVLLSVAPVVWIVVTGVLFPTASGVAFGLFCCLPLFLTVGSVFVGMRFSRRGKKFRD